VATEPIVLPQAPIAQSAVLEVIPSPKKRSRTNLAILIVLFIASYGLLLTLVVFQGMTINTQRLLILDLFRDSSELNAMRMKDTQKNQATKSDKAQPDKNKAKAAPKGHAAKPKHQMQMPVPQQPEGADFNDTRRVQNSI
jgi:hypothetical protein